MSDHAVIPPAARYGPPFVIVVLPPGTQVTACQGSTADAVLAALRGEHSTGTAIVVADGPKMLRETFCVAQIHVGLSGLPRAKEHVMRLQRLIDECDRHRPLGPDGKHGTRHTPTCGCEDVA